MERDGQQVKHDQHAGQYMRVGPNMVAHRHNSSAVSAAASLFGMPGSWLVLQTGSEARKSLEPVRSAGVAQG